MSSNYDYRECVFVFTFSSVLNYKYANNIAKIILVQCYPRDPEAFPKGPVPSKGNLKSIFKEVKTGLKFLLI